MHRACLSLITAAAAAGAAAAADLVWTDGTDLRLRNHADWGGADLPNPYARLPSRAKNDVRASVYGLSTNAAGVQLAFSTNASRLSFKWRVGESSCLGEATVPVALCAGADLYESRSSVELSRPGAFATRRRRYDGATRHWRWVATATNISSVAGVVGTNESLQSPFYAPPTPGRRHYLLNLPAYDAVLSAAVGADEAVDATAPGEPYDGFDERAPVVWYGTSITQGAAASRPGMVATNVASRELGVEILNFGFSGNGKMELNVSQYIANLTMSAFVVDCLHNMDAALVKANAEPLVRDIRSRTDAPIVLAEGIPYGSSWQPTSASRVNQVARREELRAAYERLVSAGVQDLHYVEGDQLFDFMPAGVPWQPTEAGTHPSDLGMASMATFWLKYLPTVLH